MLVLQVYAQKIGQCLAKALQDGADPAMQRGMCKWTCQCSSLLVFLAVGNLKKFLSFTVSKLDGTMGTSATQLADAWYKDLLVNGLLSHTASHRTAWHTDQAGTFSDNLHARLAYSIECLHVRAGQCTLNGGACARFQIMCSTPA